MFSQPLLFSTFQALSLPLALSAAGQSIADQVTRYEYDALGRLIKVERETSDTTVEQVEYDYDPAGNRSNVTTATSSADNQDDEGDNPQSVNFIVLPISGYTLQKIQNSSQP